MEGVGGRYSFGLGMGLVATLIHSAFTQTVTAPQHPVRTSKTAYSALNPQRLNRPGDLPTPMWTGLLIVTEFCRLGSHRGLLVCGAQRALGHPRGED